MIDFDIVKYLIGFFIVAIAAYEIAKYFQKKIHFPLITGLIITGILVGSSFLGFIPEIALKKLNFLNEISLAVIAFTAGAELHLETLRSRIKSIKWMTISQLFATFTISSLFIYLLSELVPFMNGQPTSFRIAVSLLFGAVFVARSPSSAIAIINEMRARGSYVKTAMGVTVIIDVAVIVLFAIVFAISLNIINGDKINITFILLLLTEIVISVIIGIAFGKIFEFLLKSNLTIKVKSGLILIIGYSIYILNHFVIKQAEIYHIHFTLEPLLIAIIASFYITNYTKYNREFEEILSHISPYIYIIFFTLTGDALSMQTLAQVIEIASVFFLIRLLALVIGGYIGTILTKDPIKYGHIAWMPYITQAGVAIGLTTMVSEQFSEWGKAFETIIIAIIVLNQIIGPPFFKWAIKYVGEAHNKHNFQTDDKEHYAVIFSLDSISLALAKLLKNQNWKVKIVTTQEVPENTEIDIVHIDKYNKKNIEKLDLKNPDSIILLYPDDDKNYEIAEWIYEKIGPPNMVTRLNTGSKAHKFKELGVKIIEPTAAMINLLDHMVRAPEATNILLGIDKNQDTIDIEVRNPDMVGLRIRDLHLPQDVIILSLKRRGNTVITHGYTQLRPADILTFVGSKNSLDELKIKFEG